MGKLLEGTAAGSTPNDNGTQAGGSVGGASESTITASSEKWTPGKSKEQGFVDVAGTSPTGDTK